MILFQKFKIILQNLILNIQTKTLFKKLKPLYLSMHCQDDFCLEPTKTKIGWGSRHLTKKLIEQDIPKHFNTYICEKYINGECKGHCIP